jgi:hypothetical protein
MTDLLIYGLVAFVAGYLSSMLYSEWTMRRVARTIAASMTPNEVRVLTELLDFPGPCPDLAIDYRRLALLDNLVLGVACLLSLDAYSRAKVYMRQDSMGGRVRFAHLVAKYMAK